MVTDEVFETVLLARDRPVGNQTVRRLLPAMQRRSVGPFVFLDHLGPESLRPGEGFDVGPHPHIGLATVTYLFDGAAMHRDSLGSVQTIVPGELNWMTAGRGIVHSERSPDDLRAAGGRFHGVQLWVALPLADEESEPTFEHVAAEAIEAVETGGARARLLAGSAYGARARVRTRSPLFLVEAHLAEGEALPLPEHAERAVYVIEGAIGVHEGDSRGTDGRVLEAHTLATIRPGPLSLRARSFAHVLLLGGEPFPEPRHMRWNFVSSSKARLDAAERDWRSGAFPRIPTDDGEPIPMP
jgi:redox-sensitive bicupin YhaK (pirin superfamily)